MTSEVKTAVVIAYLDNCSVNPCCCSHCLIEREVFLQRPINYTVNHKSLWIFRSCAIKQTVVFHTDSSNFESIKLPNSSPSNKCHSTCLSCIVMATNSCLAARLLGPSSADIFSSIGLAPANKTSAISATEATDFPSLARMAASILIVIAITKSEVCKGKPDAIIKHTFLNSETQVTPTS